MPEYSSNCKRKHSSRLRIWKAVLFVCLLGGFSFGGNGAAAGLQSGVLPPAIYAEAASSSNYVTSSELNVRESASTSAAKLGLLAKGETVSVYSISNGWAKIDYNGSTGYVASQYLSKPGTGASGSSGGSSAAASARSSSAGGGDTMVWLSATGSKYHSKNNCGRMNPSKARQTTRSAAEASGYKACSKCW